MDLFKELISVIKVLKGKRYLLAGGLAYALYVQPRFTEDIDFVIVADDFEMIRQRLLRLGFLNQRNIMEFKKAKIGRCIKIKGGDTFTVDFLLIPKNIFARFYQRHKIIKYGEMKLRVIAPEDLIKLKHDRASPQNRLDIKQLWRVLKGQSADEK